MRSSVILKIFALALRARAKVVSMTSDSKKLFTGPGWYYTIPNLVYLSQQITSSEDPTDVHIVPPPPLWHVPLVLLSAGNHNDTRTTLVASGPPGLSTA